MEEGVMDEYKDILMESARATDILKQGFKLYPIKEVNMLNKYMSQEAQNPKNFNKGTTTLGFVFDLGIILAVDSRASMGPIVSTQNVSKVIEINSYLLGTMAGGAADCSYWERHLAKLCRLYELRNQCRISVGAASQMLANIFYYFKGYGLSAGTMIAGHDVNGFGLYYVSNDGERMKGKLFSVGSGSMFAYGVIDEGYRSDLTLPEAVELASRAIYHAAHRDGYSGGVVNLYHVHKDGWTKLVDRRDVNDIHYHYAEKKGMPGDAILNVESKYGFAVLRPYLRKIKVKNRIPRDELKRRSEFSKQLNKELRAKYWQRLNPNVNDVLVFDYDKTKSYDIDPKRGFVVQEVIPRMVEITDTLKPLQLDNKSSESFDRHAGLQFLSNIAGVTSVFVELFENIPYFKPLKEMGPSELLPRLQTDIAYISSLLNVDNPILSNSTKEYMDFLNSLSSTSEMRLLSHCYVFFKEWDISKNTLLTNFRHHLKLVNKLKCAFFDPDTRNLEYVLNLLSQNWSRNQKDEFLNEMPLAYQKLSESLLLPFI